MNTGQSNETAPAPLDGWVGLFGDPVGHSLSAVFQQAGFDAVEVYSRYSFPTQVIAASLRHPPHVLAAARAGAHIATVPYKVLLQLIHHPLTDIGISRFADDWREVGKK